jgi:hypothetical protein
MEKQHTKQSQPTVEARLTSQLWTQPFQNGWSYGIKNYCIEVSLNGISCLPNFMEIYQSVQKLLVGNRQDKLKFYKPAFISGK